MTFLRTLTPLQIGSLSATIAVVLFSINDSAIKFLSGGYPLHEIVLIRSVLGLILICAVIAPLTDGFAMIRTKRLGLHLIRGLFVVAANMTFFLGLAAMPLADAVAIFFISPLLITAFSVIFLKESVGPRRWAAILVGLLGVVVMMRPGTGSFQYASFFPLIAAVCYAGLHMLTRVIGRTESAASMAFYIQITFIAVCIVVGLTIGDGRFGNQTDPSLVFLLRAWVWPEMADLPVMLILGVGVGFGGYCISQAYRVAPAAVVAPFEYLALPLSVLWGVLVFDEWPDAIAFVGMTLILGAGLFTVWREGKVDRLDTVPNPRIRR